ncbi:MAG: hypothetical protein K0M45_03065 [Candidatus Paracaedibacteraceae bacterium]|nr:hypothetical protein [Candidatus Paracaedibacteraceae bacterium]
MKKLIPFLVAGIFTDAAAQESSFSVFPKTYIRISGSQELRRPLPTQVLIPTALIYNQGAKSAEDFCQQILEQITVGNLTGSWDKLSQEVKLEIIFYKIIRWATNDIGYPSSNNSFYFPAPSAESMENFYEPLSKILARGFRRGHGSRAILIRQCHTMLKTFKEESNLIALTSSQPKVHFSIHTKEDDGQNSVIPKMRENSLLQQRTKFNRTLKKLSIKRLIKFGFAAPTLEHIHEEMDYLCNLYFFIKLAQRRGYQSPFTRFTLDHTDTTVNNGLTPTQQVLADLSFTLDKSQLTQWEPIFHRISDWANNRLASRGVSDPTTAEYIDEMGKLLKLYTFITRRGVEQMRVPSGSTLYSTIFSGMKAWEEIFNQALESLRK